MGDAAEAVGVELFEDGGGDLDGDDEAEVLAVSDHPAEGSYDLYGSWKRRCAFVEDALWVLGMGYIDGR